MSIFRSRSARRRALLAAAAVAVVAGGVGAVSGMAPATARQDPAQASFRCALPDGGQVDTPVEVGLSVPGQVTAGTPLAATPTVAVVLPADAVAALRAGGATTVSGSATAEIALRQGGADTPLPAAEVSAGAAELPADGDLALTMTGPDVLARPDAGAADLVLAGLTARLRAGADGKADQAVDCGAYAGGETLGGTTVVAAAPERAAPMEEPVAPAAGLKVTFDVDVVNTIAKVGADIAIKGELETFLDIFAPPPSPVTGTLKLFDVKNAYLVVFRFMPVHNSIQFPEGKVTGTARVDVTQQPWVAAIDTVSDISLRLYDVRQDGVDLKVGGACRTVKPMKVALKGDITLVPGATSEFTTTSDLPAFGGCGTKEDLDPLIGGLVSGPDNPMTVRLKLKCIDTNCG